MRQDNRSEATNAAADHETLFCSVVVDSMAEAQVRGETLHVIADIPRVVGVLSKFRVPPTRLPDHSPDSASLFSEKAPIRSASTPSEPDSVVGTAIESLSGPFSESPPVDKPKSPVIAILEASVSPSVAPEPSRSRSVTVPRVSAPRRRARNIAGVTVLILTAAAVFYGVREATRPVMPAHRTSAQVTTSEIAATSRTDPSDRSDSSAPSFASESVHRNRRPVNEHVSPATAERYASTEITEQGPRPNVRFGNESPELPTETNPMVSLPASQAFADASGEVIVEPRPSLPIPPETPTLPEHENGPMSGSGLASSHDGAYPDTGSAAIRMIPESSTEYPQTEAHELDVRP